MDKSRQPLVPWINYHRRLTLKYHIFLMKRPLKFQLMNRQDIRICNSSVHRKDAKDALPHVPIRVKLSVSWGGMDKLCLSMPRNQQRYESHRRCGRTLSPAGGGGGGGGGAERNFGNINT